MKISPKILMSPTTAKIEKKTPNIAAGLCSERFQVNTGVSFVQTH
jgi:hypothetical protein